MLRQWGCCQDEHELCIVDVAAEYSQKGFDVYLEYEIFPNLEEGKRIVVDILAKKENEIIAIEVGSLSEYRSDIGVGNRLFLIKDLLKATRVVHITQWKNWINQFQWQDAFDEWFYEKYRKTWEKEILKKMGDSLR